MYAAIRLTDDCSPGEVEDALGGELAAAPGARIRITFLDTFDWRLAGSGGRLWRESSGGHRTLHWVGRAGDPPYSLPAPREVRWASDLPDGYLSTQLTPLMGLRALIEVGRCRLQRRVAAVRDRDGNNALHAHIDRIEVLSEAGTPVGEPVTLVHLRGVPGFEDAYERALAGLRTLGQDTDREPDVLSLTVAATGREVGDYSSKLRLSLSPDQPSDEALRTILRALLETLAANVEGTIADLDTEFLHDLRVAARRTRSALTQLKRVLATDRVAPFLAEFKWLGTVTGPCRDLDVFQLEMASYGSILDDRAGDLEPLHQVIAEARADAHREVCDALASPRIQRLLADWSAFVDQPIADQDRTPGGRSPILGTASARILKAYRRMVKRGQGLASDPPAEALHRLRIDAKKLRYLLEFFRSLYPQKKIDRLVKELKGFQDILGGFNDMEVQQHRLTRFGHALSSDGQDRTATLLAMGRLAAALEERQEGYRQSFDAAFEAFAAPKSQRRYAALFGPKA